MGRQQLALSETDIRELLYDSIRAVEPAAAGGIAIVPDFPEEPVMVSCDDTRLRRAVTNILSNGVRYARSELRLTCRAEKRHVTIRIQDDGDGIAEEDLPHIFDRFYMGKSGKSGSLKIGKRCCVRSYPERNAGQQHRRCSKQKQKQMRPAKGCNR